MTDLLQFIFTASSSCFVNLKIDRKINLDFFLTLGDYLSKEQAGVWLDISKSRFLIFPKSLDVYCDSIVQWATKNGCRNSVETLFHISESSNGYEFADVPDELLLAALKKLESRGKCEILKDGLGVRFSI